MPWIISIFLGGLLRMMGSFVGRVLVSLGFGFVEYLGISSLVDNIKQQAQTLITSAGASFLSDWMGFFRIDQHISILISAVGVKLLMSALTGDKVRRLTQK